jgi:hypothetical protein
MFRLNPMRQQRVVNQLLKLLTRKLLAATGLNV